MTGKVRQIIAQTLLKAREGVSWNCWDDHEMKEFLIEDADSILASLKEAGYVVVPVEPTEEMKEAARKVHFDSRDHTYAWQTYKAMVTLPQSPSSQ